MGLTWIDHETIDKPIEEITLGTGEAQEIEFHVETLKCDQHQSLKPAKKEGGGLSIKVRFKFGDLVTQDFE